MTLKEKLKNIKNWCIYAYPENSFRELKKQDWENIKNILEKHNYSLSDISISNYKHVLDGILEIINKK